MKDLDNFLRESGDTIESIVFPLDIEIYEAKRACDNLHSSSMGA